VNGTLDVYEKRNNSGIPIPKPVPPHPNSVDIGQLKDLLAAQSRIRSISLSGFLKRNFCRIGDKGIADLLERVSLLQYFDERGFFAGDIIKRIAQSSKLRELRGNYGKINSYLKTLVRDVDIDYDYATELVMRGKLNGNTNIRALSNTELERLFRVNDGELPKPPFTSRTTVNMILNDENRVRLLAEALRSMSFPSPPMDSLMPIPKDTFIEGFTSMYEPEKYAYVERRPTSTSGRPVQVQVLAMYGGNIPTNLKDQDKLIRIANCTPLLYEFGSDIVTQVAKEIDWSIYRIGKKGSLPDAPVIFVVHVTSPQLKYLGVAKQAIGADDVIAEEIRLALQAASRHLRSHVTMLARNKSAGKARKYLEHYAGIVSNSLSKMLKVKKEEVHDLLIQEINRRRPSVKDLPESFREW
jgi:DNA topoisomerase VI B subunit